jgi:N-acetylglucosaminyldiphosphoundecaprenol N-acetyl-beta-D-mannosaminyltransferase
MITGIRVDATSYADATERIMAWAAAGESRYVCVSNIHAAVEASESPEFHKLMLEADLVTPDGMSLVRALHILGVKEATRVYGPTLTLHVCEQAAQRGVPVAVYGGREDAQAAFAAAMCQRFPGLRLVKMIAPPFRLLTAEEQAEEVRCLNDSGARIVLVALGCPKQERWMAAHRGLVMAVMIGVGAALDFHAGRLPTAPGWMQRAGLEWLFRLITEPRRLWRRYFHNIPRFLWMFLRQLLRRR